MAKTFVSTGVLCLCNMSADPQLILHAVDAARRTNAKLIQVLSAATRALTQGAVHVAPKKSNRQKIDFQYGARWFKADRSMHAFIVCCAEED